MTVYYIGSGGSDGADGLSWANRKATISSLDTTVTAGDTVYVGPGTYRGAISAEVTGSSGSPITYIGDVSGANTDGVGGVVRLTGSDDDQTATRSVAIGYSGSGTISYRTFRGFTFDTYSSYTVTPGNLSTNDSWIIEDCVFYGSSSTGSNIYLSGDKTNFTIRRCLFLAGIRFGVELTHATGLNTSHLIENCYFTSARGINPSRVGGFTVKNCTFAFGAQAIRIGTAPTQAILAYNNVIAFNTSTALQAVSTSDITEDYNLFYCNNSDRSNVNTGTNSVTYTPGLMPPYILGGLSGYTPLGFHTLAPWSPVKGITGSSASSEDVFGVARPATASKIGWGYAQHQPVARDTSTTHSTSTASLKLSDAGVHRMLLPVSATSTTVTAQVYREANYAGTLPQLVVRQDGQSASTTTDTGSSAQWNQISVNLTPSANTDYVVVELVSNNTATSGSYAVYFDSITVT